jgi:hypothetical protein
MKLGIERGQYMSFVRHPTTTTDRWDVGQVAAIDIPTEDALIEIFDFYLYHTGYNGWHTLVHGVCQSGETQFLVHQLPGPVASLHPPNTCEAVTAYPATPSYRLGKDYSPSGFDNIVATLEHNDHVCEVTLYDRSFLELEDLVATIQRPFPELASP